MSEKLKKLPQDNITGVFPNRVAVRTPWDKLISFKDSMYYISRYNAVVGAAVMQAWRILVPDYADRSKLMCEEAYARLHKSNIQGGWGTLDTLNIHPFCRGAFVGALSGDSGDETLLMCGRVNDFGTYRCEKELDVCHWDIIGTELCRETTMSLQAGADVFAEILRKGPSMEYCMVEAKGAGDRHCRIVAESREKYPMPEHEIWESFGPIATGDEIRFTTEPDTVKEPDVLDPNADFRYESGTHQYNGIESLTMNQYCCAATFYLLPAFEEAIKRGLFSDEEARRVLKCVCEAAGKAAWGDYVAIDAHKEWLGVPKENWNDDGRVLGAEIEVYLQAMGVDYTVEAFNEEEVIINFDRYRLGLGYNKFVEACLIPYWYGEAKTLINAQWSLWEEPGDTGYERCRIKIAKKIDKFC